MGTAKFKCECGKEQSIAFTPGEKPTPPTCECGKIMKRIFQNIGVGDIVDDDCMNIGRMMTYHSNKK